MPIERGPVQKEVWRFAKALAFAVAARRPDILTAEYKIAKRPQGRCWSITTRTRGVDAGLGLLRASHPRATVSTPVTWEEIELGVAIDDFRVITCADGSPRTGDLWAPLLRKSKRVGLQRFL